MSLGVEMLAEIRATTKRIALELGVIGLINIQYAVAGGELYVIEANPRASRTVPFVSKATGVPLAKVAARLMLGEKLADQELREPPAGVVSVKEAVLPFARFAGADSVLGPEMKSTGEVMGIAADFPAAFAPTRPDIVRREEESARQVRRKPLRQLGARQRADDPVDGLTVPEDDQQRDAHRLVALGQGRVGVDVDLDHLEVSGVLLGERVEHRRDHPAGAAPRRPEVRHHRYRGHDLLAERGAIGVNDPGQVLVAGRAAGNAPLDRPHPVTGVAVGAADRRGPRAMVRRTR
jgi:hypothetical protein